MYILFSREVQVSGPKRFEVTKRSTHPIKIKYLNKKPSERTLHIVYTEKYTSL
jgi:hypothetical protein